MLQSRQGLVRLAMQFMMAGIQIVHKLQVHMMFQFAVYKDGGMEVRQKVHEHQEGAIREYIDRLDKINMCARPQMIVGAANYLIRFANRLVGHQWLKRFLERNHKYHIRKQNP